MPSEKQLTIDQLICRKSPKTDEELSRVRLPIFRHKTLTDQICQELSLFHENIVGKLQHSLRKHRQDRGERQWLAGKKALQLPGGLTANHG